MKILHVFKTFFPDTYGGIEETIKELCLGLKSDIKSEVLVMSKTPQNEPFYWDGIRVHQAKTNIEIASTPFSLNAIKKFKELAPQFDLIHFHYPFPYGDLISEVSRLKKPYIVTYHSDIVRQKFLKYVYRPLEVHFLNKAELLVCTSTQYLKTSKNLKKYRNKTVAVNLGLSDESLDKVKKEIPKEFQYINNKPFFLFIGALRKYKGINVLLEAAKNIDAQIVIAGGGKVDAYKQFVLKNKMKNVHLLGEVDDDFKHILLDKCYGLILPSNSRNEAFGLVQLEAAMRGKPLICTEIGTGTSFVNEHENTGLVVRPDDHEALRNAINFLILHPIIAERMGQSARKRYKSLFSSQKMCSEYLNIYQNILKKDLNITRDF